MRRTFVSSVFDFFLSSRRKNAKNNLGLNPKFCLSLLLFSPLSDDATDGSNFLSISETRICSHHSTSSFCPREEETTLTRITLLERDRDDDDDVRDHELLFFFNSDDTKRKYV